VFELMAQGVPAYKACRQAGVAWSSFKEWMNADPSLAAKYARAREALLDFMANEILTISDEVPPTVLEVARARLRVDTRKWLLSKLAPKKYG
jgi:hypothetical protein